MRTPDYPVPPSSQITPEGVYRARRRLLGAALAAPVLATLGACGRGQNALQQPDGAVSADGFRTTETQTSYYDARNYNNFYEFGTGKIDPARNAGTLRAHPWSITVDGECEKPGTFALEDFWRGLHAQERTYRMRCVEGWSMVLPWLGIPLALILTRYRPTSKAKFVAFTTLSDRQQMPSLGYFAIDWPYREGLRIDEAMHPLTILAVGLYGRALPNANGAPIRLVVPWKYGFKGIKSIVRISFVESMPVSSWHAMQPDEYGFYSNVNPAVDHPRWTQKTERRIAGSTSKLLAIRLPTAPFNGYAAQVAGMYAGMDLRKWF
ncbi:MAG: protein-methionine-sulfoxide reductase catalytic subunit MsrP [Lysobacteraceae bacterium]